MHTDTNRTDHLGKPDFGIPLPPRREPPQEYAPNWARILGVLPWTFPLFAIAPINLALVIFPALRERLAETATPVGFALPHLPGLEIICLTLLWVIALTARFTWQVALCDVNGEINLDVKQERAFWLRFLSAFFLACLVANGFLSHSYTPEDIAFGVTFMFDQIWAGPALLVFVLVLIPWHTSFPQQEKEP